ncbi:M14 family zinc carboxypeptidase [Haliangium sp.]|uniref:M14 family zinc carboxypeptidase n=1 Tax=Haliangium sp. TaxID=2663208 RepID=UPI003D123C6D
MHLRWTLCLLSGALAACAPTTPAPVAPVTPGVPSAVDYGAEAALPRPSGDDYDVAFFPGTDYDPDLPTPEACLGHPAGARLATPEAILGCFRAWAERSPRVRIEPYSESYEGRPLVRVIITSPDNHARLDDILADLGKLADPRGVDAATLDRIVRDGPAVAWFGYSIHGDEVSGADASVAFGHHLIAARGDDVAALLDHIVVVIDPVMNPDGRARILSQIQQSASRVPNLDDTSMHRGRWPWGRGNHYLFDMNRDWITGAAPETRGRWQGLLRYHPQLVIDAHEMGPRDTYLFYPYADPVNPYIAPSLLAWQRRFAADHGRAFDRYGWAYYTREWADGWYPGYTDAWASLSGAIGILYEQSSTKGQALRRPSGRRVTYRESVHAQAVSSLANLRTLAANRAAVMADYLADKRRQVAPEGPARSFALVPGRVPDRERRLVTTLRRQGIEVVRADAAFTARNLVSSLGASEGRRELPAGTWLVSLAQPRGALARALLEFDTRFSSAFLHEERQELERKAETKIYDVTAWSLGQAYGLDGYWIDTPGVSTSAAAADPPAPGVVAPAAGRAYAWVVDGRDDASVAFALRAMEEGITVHVADHTFDTAGRSFAPGSVLVRAGDNRADIEARLGRAAAAAGVQAIATGTGRSPSEGPDLGGHHFRLLHQPRVAILTGAPIWPDDFGHIWHQIDQELAMPMSMLDVQYLDRYDLRRYDVLIVPPGPDQLEALLDPAKAALAAWVRAGGTLIAAGNAASVVATKSLGLSRVRRRRDVLDELPLYQAAAARAVAARDISVSEDAVWTGVDSAAARAGDDQAGKAGAGKAGADKAGAGQAGAGKPDGTLAEQRDRWMRRFGPRGTILRALVDDEHWLGFGVEEAEMPVMIMGEHALLAPDSVEVPVRLADAARLRLAGLLWPEARARLALSAYLTTERMGAGQVILFASAPSFRGAFPATARLLANAVVYGPSLGATPALDW